MQRIRMMSSLARRDELLMAAVLVLVVHSMPMVVIHEKDTAITAVLLRSSVERKGKLVWQLLKSHTDKCVKVAELPVGKY